ncbi:MAG: hypothetical protein J07HX64_03059 [halophilic archaeon J07HX64]|nr:MAG: hypothetical protein J07HX64_03059 [halophilic archaeon J07HX64]
MDWGTGRLAHPLEHVRVREFDLEGEQVGTVGQGTDRRLVVEPADHLVADDRAGRGVGSRVRYHEVDTEGRGRRAEHPAQLAAPDDAECGLRGNV